MVDVNIRDIELGSTHEPVNNIETTLLKFQDKYRCRFLVHNYFPPSQEPFVLNLASQNPQLLERSRAFVRNSIDFCASLSIPIYTIHPGFMVDFDPPVRGGFVKLQSPKQNGEKANFEKAFEIWVESLIGLIEYAQEQDVQLIIENMYNSEGQSYALMSCPEDFRRLISELSTVKPLLLIDLGHLKVAANWDEFDYLSLIDEVAPYIQIFHLHDNDGIADIHQPVRSDSWALEILRRTEFAKLPVVVEAKFNSISDLCKHGEWLKSQLGRE